MIINPYFWLISFRRFRWSWFLIWSSILFSTVERWRLVCSCFFVVLCCCCSRLSVLVLRLLLQDIYATVDLSQAPTLFSINSWSCSWAPALLLHWESFLCMRATAPITWEDRSPFVEDEDHFSDCAFSAAGPRCWNSLYLDLLLILQGLYKALL